MIKIPSKHITLFYFVLLYLLGFSQKTDSITNKIKAYPFEKKQTIIPSYLMLVGGIVSIMDTNSAPKNSFTEKKSIFGISGNAEDYLQFGPTAAVYGLERLGLPAKTDWKNRTAILIKGQIINTTTTFFIKKIVNDTRPDGSQFAFPSGHTSIAFASATMLAIEYGEYHKWVPYIAYGFSTGIGILRMTNKKHYLSDIIFGAGLGILSMKFSYWTHQYKWKKKNKDYNPLNAVYKN